MLFSCRPGERERETRHIMQNSSSGLDLVPCDDHGRCHSSPLLQTTPERSNVCNEIDDECRLERTAARRNAVARDEVDLKTNKRPARSVRRHHRVAKTFVSFSMPVFSCRRQAEELRHSTDGRWQGLLISSMSGKDEAEFNQVSAEARQEISSACLSPCRTAQESLAMNASLTNHCQKR